MRRAYLRSDDLACVACARNCPAKATRRVLQPAEKVPKRYGYTAAYRREDVPFHSTNLTGAEWDMVVD